MMIKVLSSNLLRRYLKAPKVLVINRAHFKNWLAITMRYYVLDVFDHEEYKYVDVDGRLVVDIGAGYGETAIYFLKRGARQVIAVSPVQSFSKKWLRTSG